MELLTKPLSFLRQKRYLFFQLDYAIVVVSAAVVFVLLTNVAVLNDGLRVTPFILITTIAAVQGNFGSGIFAIFLGSTAVEYVTPPRGFTLTSDALFKTLEFAIIGTIIFLLSWKSRRLRTSNLALRDTTNKLQEIALELRAEARGNKKQAKKLNKVNKELISLVNNFVADDEYWGRKLSYHSSIKPNQRIIHATEQSDQ